MVPTTQALIAAILSIAIKESMYWYTRYYAIKIDSSALMADAWHHRSDSLSSIGAMIGIGGAMAGYPILDTIASIIISIFIIRAAYDIFRDAVDKVIDKSCDNDFKIKINDYILASDDILGIDKLRARVFGNKVFVDVEVLMDGKLSLYEAHSIIDNLHNNIEEQFPKIKHIMIHINPTNDNIRNK